MEKFNIKVERDTYEKEGKSFFSYFIKGNIRGKDIRIGVVPPDNGGYTVLDIVFGNSMSAELKVKPFEIKNEASGEVITGNTYSVYSEDEDGTVYECPIKPSRVSDKNMMKMLIR